MITDPHTEDDSLVWLLVNQADLYSLVAEIRDALEGESNDAEHDALVSVAGILGIGYRDPYDEDE